MSESNFYGFETLWKLVGSTVETKSEVLIVFVHWFLTKHGFLCVGVGDDKTLNDGDEKSELLPERWNCDRKTYAMRYVFEGNLYILFGNVSDETMVVNLLSAKDQQVSVVAFELESTVLSLRGDTLSALIANVGKQLVRLKDDMIQPVVTGVAKDGQTQTDLTEKRLQEFDKFRGRALTDEYPESMPSRARGLQIGSTDLNPLAVPGSGMLMEPPRNPLADRFRGRGARFDPFGPNPMRNYGPDPDHMAPPGRYDDMFM
ncbi:proteasome inhibitor PI31 subunit [Anopheles cruzii]|uniref:proteasome inhibitor PI31 subunit n=1 Tax=Anopheles cruzii TaxID=68878 RepID=UPI0022EC987F|nr:proteasome inhibitor PI31 subunit [Anopheles cruzii]